MNQAARIVVLSVNGVPLSYEVGRSVRHWGDVHAGDEVSATLKEELTVYVSPLKQIRGSPDAHVLLVDPAYRVLEVEYANGGTMTFKVGLRARMEGIEAGDAVKMFPVEVTKLRLRRHSNAALAR